MALQRVLFHSFGFREYSILSPNSVLKFTSIYTQVGFEPKSFAISRADVLPNEPPVCLIARVSSNPMF